MSEPYPDDIEALKQRKMAEMRRRAADEERVDRARQEVETQKQSLLKVILSPEARSRLNNLKMVRPDFAEQIELQLIQIAQEGHVKLPLDDEQLKRILIELQRRKRDITITRM